MTVKITHNWKKVSEKSRSAVPKALKDAAAYVRAVAKNSIRKRKNLNLHSVAPNPPYSHGGSAKKSGTELRNSIMFAAGETSAVIGPVHRKGGLGNVARLHEFGLSRRIQAINQKEFDKKFYKGQIARVSSKYFRRGDKIYPGGGQIDPQTGKKVFMMELRTVEMAQHATRLNRRLVLDEAKWRMVKYPARPFMRPALEKCIPIFPKKFKNIIAEE